MSRDPDRRSMYMTGKGKPEAVIIPLTDEFLNDIIHGADEIEIRMNAKNYELYMHAVSNDRTDPEIYFSGTDRHGRKVGYKYTGYLKPNSRCPEMPTLMLTKVPSDRGGDRSFEPSRKKRKQQERERAKERERRERSRSRGGRRQQSSKCVIL